MQNFNVDISAPGGPLVFYAMQADSLSRFFTLTIADNGEAWDPPDGALWSVRFGAPQMPSGWYDKIEDATDATHSAVNIETGVATVATVEIAEQALSTPGQNILCVLVTDSSGYQIASWPIILSIQAVPGLTAPEVTTYYNLLTGQVAQTLQNAQAASESATLSESWAVGGTGSRTGEDTNNSEYWAQQSQAAANNRVASFNGRTGAVMPQIGDYTAGMVSAISNSPAELMDEDLNNIKVYAGYYYASGGNSVANVPSGFTGLGFGLFCQQVATLYIAQIFTGGSFQFIRYFNGSEWDEWSKIYNSKSPPTASDVGALSVNGTAKSANKLASPVNIGSASFDGSQGITLDEIGAVAKPTLLWSGEFSEGSITVNGLTNYKFFKVRMDFTNDDTLNTNYNAYLDASLIGALFTGGGVGAYGEGAWAILRFGCTVSGNTLTYTYGGRITPGQEAIVPRTPAKIYEIWGIA